MPEWLVALIGDCIDHEAENRPAVGADLTKRWQLPEPQSLPAPVPASSLLPDSVPALSDIEEAEADYQQGEAYWSGWGRPRDLKKAQEFFERAAAQGHANAQKSLGVLYETGEVVPLNYEKAREWYEKAAAQGHAGAQYNLARIFEYGQGVAQDEEKAMEWYRQAAESGDENAKQQLGRLEKSKAKRRVRPPTQPKPQRTKKRRPEE